MPLHRLPFARSLSPLLDALILPDRSSSLADPPNVLDRQQAPILQGFAGRREVKRNGATVQENSTLLLCYSHLAAGRRFLDMVSKMTEPPCKGRSCRKNLKTRDDSPQSLPRSPHLPDMTIARDACSRSLAFAQHLKVPQGSKRRQGHPPNGGKGSPTCWGTP